MLQGMKIAAAAAVAGAIALGAGMAGAADYGKKEFTVVGTWGFLDHWKERESKFWQEVIPEASGGALTANAKPLTELGLSGFEVMRLMKLGTYDAVHGVTTYVSQDSPAIEGADLAGTIQDLGEYRKAVEAYASVIEREFAEKYDDAKLLMLYAWPSQQLWCNLGDKSITDFSLDDLEGKKIRTYSTTLGDFIEGVGGSAVTIAFGRGRAGSAEGRCRLRPDRHAAGLQRQVVAGGDPQYPHPPRLCLLVPRHEHGHLERPHFDAQNLIMEKLKVWKRRCGTRRPSTTSAAWTATLPARATWAIRAA